MDIRAKLIDRNTVAVVDIDAEKEIELFRFNQRAGALQDLDESSAAYIEIKSEYDSAVQKLEDMPHFVESEIPELGEFDVAVPYYEEDSRTVYQRWEVQHNSAPLIYDEIERIKKQLAGSDYKIIKCNEANLVGAPDPYDMQLLHKERQALRDRINALEKRVM